MAKSARRRRDEEDEDDDRPRRRKGSDGVPPGTPRVYMHKKCGRHTKMPADVIRTYLDNPFHYNPETYCSGCEKDVPWKGCVWVDTGENLLDYFEDLQARTLLAGNDPREDETRGFVLWFAPLVGAILMGVVGAGAGYKAGSALVGGAIGAVVGIGVGLIHAYRESRTYERTKEEYDEQLLKNFYSRHPEERPKKGRRRRDDD